MTHEGTAGTKKNGESRLLSWLLSSSPWTDRHRNQEFNLCCWRPLHSVTTSVPPVWLRIDELWYPSAARKSGCFWKKKKGGRVSGDAVVDVRWCRREWGCVGSRLVAGVLLVLGLEKESWIFLLSFPVIFLPACTVYANLFFSWGGSCSNNTNDS
jgi:hypothetical protein